MIQLDLNGEEVRYIWSDIFDTLWNILNNVILMRLDSPFDMTVANMLGVSTVS
jgi:hypothetical protein